MGAVLHRDIYVIGVIGKGHVLVFTIEAAWVHF